jgi:hypothetical protein
MKLDVLPLSSLQTGMPRCRQAFKNTRILPSAPRATMTGSSPMERVTKSPAWGISDSWAT